MYTGTLIQDLMATVERVERDEQQKRTAAQRMVDDMELRQIFALQFPAMNSEPIYAGAA